MSGLVIDLQREWEERSTREGLLRVMRQTHSREAAAQATVETLAALSESTRLLKETAAIRGDKCAVELGCGMGRMSALIAGHFKELHCVDFSSGMLQLAVANLAQLSNITFTRADLTEFLGQRVDKEFQVGYSVWVLMHILDDELLSKTLKEVVRTCRSFVLVEYTSENVTVSGASRIRTAEEYLEYLGNPPVLHRSQILYGGDISTVLTVDLRS